jgi:hypothetical protein
MDAISQHEIARQTAFMAKNWRDLPVAQLDTDVKTDTYGKFTCEPLERGFGTHPGQLAAAGPAVVPAGRGHHPRPRSTARCTSSPPFRASPRTSPTSSSTSRRSWSRSRTTAPSHPASTRREGPGDRRRHPGADQQVTILNPEHVLAPCPRVGAVSAELTVMTWAGATCPPSATRSRACPSAPSPSTPCSAHPQGQLHGHQRPRRPADRLRQAHPRGLDQRRRPAVGRRRLRGQDPQGPAHRLHQLRGRRGAPRAQVDEESRSTRTSSAPSTSSSCRSARPTACRTPTSGTSASWCRRPSPRCSRPRTSAASRSRRSKRSSPRWA